MVKKILLTTLSLSLFLLTSCGGVNQKKLDDASARLEKLSNSGLPDSLLIDAKMGLFEAKKAKKKNLSKEVKENYNLAIVALDKADSILAKSISDKKPLVTESLNSLKEKSSKELKGLHLKAMDSILDTTEKLIQKDWILDAEKSLSYADSLLTDLQKQQDAAQKLKPKLYGTWKYDRIITNSEDKSVHAEEIKIFSFYKNGKAKFVEQKKGKSAPALKEDWKFVSYGTWDVKGDTIKVFVNRFACPIQKFEELHNKDGKMVWEKKSQPTYDSTITDGSQDRYITYEDLKEDFVKQR